MDENYQEKINSYARKNGSRPSSFYDNFRDINGQSETGNITYLSPNEACEEQTEQDIDVCRDKSPTQEFLLKTTVPQNLAAANLAGRHTPTRNSLRHSRMIVMNRSGVVPPSNLPPVVKHYRLAVVLVALQSLLGAIVCCLAAWLLLWTPNLRRRDNPYWSGLPLLASGCLGLLFLCCCRREHPGTIRGHLITTTKILSVLLSLIAAAAGFIASVFALIHILTLEAMTCETKIQLNDTCFCEISANSTLPVKSYHYKDLKCDDVYNIFIVLVIFSCVVNAIAGCVSLWYVYLYFSMKYDYLYSKVRTKNSSPAT